MADVATRLDRKRLAWCPGGGKRINDDALVHLGTWNYTRSPVHKKSVRCPRCKRLLKCSVIDCGVWNRVDMPRVNRMSCTHRWIPNHKIERVISL